MASERSRLELSVVIPAHNEEQNLRPTVTELIDALDAARIPFQLVVVNDNSTDGTGAVADELASERGEIHIVTRGRLPGFGRAVRAGLAASTGDVVAIVMADRSDDPRDVVRCYRKIEEGYDCVFGSRFRQGSVVEGYPPLKLAINRLVNKLIQLLFWSRFNDLTNAFKTYRREVVAECGPYSSSHFNITIEMSLSAMIRGYQIAEIPINWYGRTWGASKLPVATMGRRYLSVVLKVFSEKMLVRDDIVAERLLERTTALDRVAALEQRISHLESELQSPRQSSRDRADGCR